MSYIISKNNPFVNTKLTENGRLKLAQGQLNFKYWSVGDSEINYGLEELRDLNPNDESLNKKSLILKPKDIQSDIKYPITKGFEGPVLNELNDNDVDVIKAVINNRAPERGFFDTNKNNKLEEPFVVNDGVIISNRFNGTNVITINSGELSKEGEISVGNYLLFKIGTDQLDYEDVKSNKEPVPQLWYKVEDKEGSNYTLDRNLPNLKNDNVEIHLIEFMSGNIYENGMVSKSVTAYWDVNTLSFDDSTNISQDDVPLWNMNNIWSQNIIGLDTEVSEEFYKYGSNDLLGLRSPFLSYMDSISQSEMQLDDVLVEDMENKAISVIHYTNNEISNLYGEFLHIDSKGKTLELEIPNIMYHRRSFADDVEVGSVMGMTFVSKGDELKIIKNSDIKYYDLIEHPDMVNGTPRRVGKVFPHHHLIVIDDDEIVAALSYKSGRNWTLPGLSLSLTNPLGGTGKGILKNGETIYVTYVLENEGNGLPYNLPCQTYAKITNNNTNSRDIRFTINNVDELPYMRKLESGSYDGRGFSANRFKVLYQIVEGDEQPVSNAWNEYDFTSTILTSGTGQTIDPKALEQQLPEVNNQILTKLVDDSSVPYVINDKLNVADNSTPEALQFGDERFFYGNVRTYIGATVFKTVFDLKISTNEFTHTTNPTRTIEEALDAPEIRVSEIGIYDNDRSLVFIGKLSEPIKLISGNTVTIELSMDF